MEAALAHVVKTTPRAAYARSDLFEKRALISPAQTLGSGRCCFVTTTMATSHGSCSVSGSAQRGFWIWTSAHGGTSLGIEPDDLHYINLRVLRIRDALLVLVFEEYRIRVCRKHQWNRQSILRTAHKRLRPYPSTKL